MKTTILIHENEEWVYFPSSSSKIDHISGTTKGECFFFDPIKSSASAVIPQKATAEDPRAGDLIISLKFDARELDWFIDRPSRIKGLKEWLKKISKADAKLYATEKSALPAKEIEEKALEFDAKAMQLNQTEKEIVLQFMTSIIAIHSTDPEIFAIARNQRDDLIIDLLKSLPKAFRKIEISMPWSPGSDLGRISTTYAAELPMLSRPMFLVPDAAEKLISKFPEQFAAAKVLFGDNRWAAENIEPSDVLNKSEKFKNIWSKLHPEKMTAGAQNKPRISPQSAKDVKSTTGTTSATPKKSASKNTTPQAKNTKIVNSILVIINEILLVTGFIYYLRYYLKDFADPDQLYTIAFVSVMVGILFSSLIFYLRDKNS